ncbi:MAG: HAD hydrolase-like protein [Bacillota bacterium]
MGLLLKAQKKYSLQLDQCFIVGDTGSSDMIAAQNAGTKKVLVKTGWGEHSLTLHRHTWEGVEPHYAADELVHAVSWIVTDSKKAKKELW